MSKIQEIAAKAVATNGILTPSEVMALVEAAVPPRLGKRGSPGMRIIWTIIEKNLVSMERQGEDNVFRWSDEAEDALSREVGWIFIEEMTP